ncbi:MAG: GTPase Era [Anaerolineales bacterium]|nr:GTPase Era [Anaerolineales bacterium]
MSEHKSGFVAIIGKPNVGKSTLVNALLGQKIAAVSPRPQTTRKKQLGILTLPNAQIVFVDTPGLHKSKHKLGEFLNQEAQEALDGVDLILWLVDSSSSPTDEDKTIADLLKKFTRRTPLLLVLNKTDLLLADDLSARENEYHQLANSATLMKISASKRLGLGEMIEKLIQLLPKREAEYPEDQITDLYEKEIAADLIREACLLKLRDEVPHSLAVRLDEFKERENGMAYIAATLLVERESQKGIVIGEAGKMMKAIGSAARKEIEEMGGRKVFLELRVKVEKDWRDNPNALRVLGYTKKK